MTHLTDECWQDFANAIVMSAVDDYRRSKFQLAHPSLASKYALNRTRECERFFCSSWFEMLTGIDSKAFMKLLKQ